MTDTQMLNGKVKESGLKVCFIAKKLGITRAGLYKKMSGKSEFKQGEIIIMKELLNLSNKEMYQIFFAHKVGK